MLPGMTLELLLQLIEIIPALLLELLRELLVT